MAPLFLLSALDKNEWSASGPCRFISVESAPGTYWIGGWVGPGTGLDAVKKKQISCPSWDSTPVIQPAASRYTEWVIPALSKRILVLLFITFIFSCIHYMSHKYLININSWTRISISFSLSSLMGLETFSYQPLNCKNKDYTSLFIHRVRCSGRWL
jgi:hypothetical protein